MSQVSAWMCDHLQAGILHWYVIKPTMSSQMCLQCFDTIRWAAGESDVVLAWLSLWREVQICIWPSWYHCHSLSLASVKSRLVLHFWYRLTRVMLDKIRRAIKRLCVCVCMLSQPCIPPPGLLNQVPALIVWSKGGNVTSAEWQVTLWSRMVRKFL